jgi:hypothetical protein
MIAGLTSGNDKISKDSGIEGGSASIDGGSGNDEVNAQSDNEQVTVYGKVKILFPSS